MRHVLRDMRRRPAVATGLAALLVASPAQARLPGSGAPADGGVVRQDEQAEGSASAAAGPPSGDGAGSSPDALSDMSEDTGESSQERGVDEAAELSAAAQARLDAGDGEGAIALWRRAYQALPGSFGYAPRRAAVALAIAAAEEAAFRSTGEAHRLHAAIQALDAYLGGLDPTDDENRAGVEERKAELVALARRTSAPEGPRPAPRSEVRRGGVERRAGLAAAGLAGAAAVGGLVALAGALAGRAADRDLARTLARPCTGDDPLEPCASDASREAAKAELVAGGLRANRTALVGGIVAATLLTAGAAALIAGAIRGRARVQARAAGLSVRF